MKVHVIKLLFLFILLTLIQVPNTSSSYVDTDTSSVTMAAGVWEDEIMLKRTLQPEIQQFTIDNKHQIISFSLNNIEDYKTMQYTITYTSYGIVRGIGPSTVNLHGDNQYQSSQFDLATCSDGVCTYDQNVTNFYLQVTLTDFSDNVYTLTNTL